MSDASAVPTLERLNELVAENAAKAKALLAQVAATATEPATMATGTEPAKSIPSEVKPNAVDDAESEEVPIVIRVPPPAEGPAPAAAPVRAAPDRNDSDSEEEEEEAPPKQVRIPRRLAGVCDEGTWRKFVAAVFAQVVVVARRVVGDDDADVVPFVRAAIEGMSFSSESTRFSTLGMDVGVPSATPQCIDLLGGLLRVTAKRAAHNPEYAKLFAAPDALRAHLEEVGARVCALPFVQAWMVIAAASARAEVWQPVARKGRKAEEPDAEAVAALARILDPPAEEEAPAPAAARAGRRKRKRENDE